MTHECYAQTTRYLLPCSDTHFSGRGAGAFANYENLCFFQPRTYTLSTIFCSAFLFAYWAAAMKGGFGHLRRAFWSHISNGALEGGEATCL